MPAELKQVSAKLVSFPPGSGSSVRPHVRWSWVCGKEKAVRAGRACLLVFSFFSRELRVKAELLFLREHSREILLLSLLC